MADPAYRWEGWVPAAQYLELDREALHRGAPTVRAGLLADRTISFGVGFVPDATLLREAELRDLPMLRRSTGGTALLHERGDLAWSLVLPRSDPRIRRGFVQAFATLGAPLQDGLRSAGLPARWAPPVGGSDRFCLFGERGDVLTVAGRVLGGAAQHATSQYLLHHGVVGAHVDRPSLAALFDVPADRLRDRLVTAEEFDPPVDLARVGRALVGGANE